MSIISKSLLKVFPMEAGHYEQTGQFMPDGAIEILGEFDAIYFGAVGLPSVR